MTKKKIAIFTSSQGHLSIAQALEKKLQGEFEIITNFQQMPGETSYIFLYQFFPKLSQIPFKASNSVAAVKNTRKFFKVAFQAKFDEFYSQHQPDLMISTHWALIPALEHLQKVTHTPLINVLADPLTLHAATISQQALTNLAFDRHTVKYAQKYYPKIKFDITGWWVRPEFETEYDQAAVRSKLGLAPQKLTFLVASGSEGTNVIAKILPTLLLNRNDLQIIVACGHNKNLYKGLKALQSFLESNQLGSKLIPLGFTDQIANYIQAVDLVIGKAGPNTIFECAATLTPFFAITHVAGQEDGNLEIIKRYKLGYVEENLIKAPQLLNEIINHPENLKKFQRPLLKIKKHNLQGQEILHKIIQQALAAL